MITNLAYELSILAKAVQHKNLSAAAVHVGLSQPQLSRVISKIENELSVILLDRTARRKSGWTPMAQELAITYSRGISRLQSDILSLAQERETTELHVGTLEGLSDLALQFVKNCYENFGMKTVFLDILDFKELDSEFLGGSLDVIFTVRSPGKQKFNHLLEVGYQHMEKFSTDKSTLVVSPFEYTGTEKKTIDDSQHVFVSNSLSLREKWLKNHGGTGALPAEPKKGKGKGHHTVYLLAGDLLSPKLWSKIQATYPNV